MLCYTVLVLVLDLDLPWWLAPWTPEHAHRLRDHGMLETETVHMVREMIPKSTIVSWHCIGHTLISCFTVCASQGLGS